MRRLQLRRRLPMLLLALALALAGAAGYATSIAVGGSSQAGRTVTVNVGSGAAGPPGPTGPAGPVGPPGPAGGITCPVGYSEGKLVFNSPGGQQAIWTCLQD